MKFLLILMFGGQLGGLGGPGGSGAFLLSTPATILLLSTLDAFLMVSAQFVASAAVGA